jgi:polysaccharide biosynthesis/export protein
MVFCNVMSVLLLNGLKRPRIGTHTVAVRLLVFALFLAGPARAQDDKAAPSVLSAEDVVRVEVVGRSDLSSQVRVDAKGLLTLPLVGSVQAAGRTPSELSADLSRRYSLIDRTITRVVVSVAEYRSQKIFVLGSVLLPGAYTFPTAPTPWEAIAEAGGPTEDADLATVEILPAEQMGQAVGQIVDVAAAIRDGRLDRLERLRPGDTVRVPRGGPSVSAGAPGDLIYVFGAVASQSAHPSGQAPDLVTALLRSGGATADADLKKVAIVRVAGPGIMRLHANLNDYMYKALPSGNPALEPGDKIYVARTKRTFFGSSATVIATALGLIGGMAYLFND